MSRVLGSVPKIAQSFFIQPRAFAILSAVAFGVIAGDEFSQGLPIDQITRKKHGFKILDPQANLLKFPRKTPELGIEKRQFTLGDLHANALKLLYFLIKEDLIDMSEEDYYLFAKIYQKDHNDILEQDLESFHKILARIKCRQIPDGGMIRFIGDDVCDRGENDYYVLKIFEKLHKENVLFEIIFSNHGYELISCFEKDIMIHTSYLETIECGTSLTHMRDFVLRGYVSLSEITALIREVYYPHLKLLSYSQDHTSALDHFTIYSHAPVGLKTIRMLSAHKNFGLSYDAYENQGPCFVIDKINQVFKSYLKQAKIIEKFDQEIHSATQAHKIPFSEPIKRCIWSRDYEEFDEPKNFWKNQSFSFVHGHDGCGHTDDKYKEFVINLDNLFGKGRGNEKRPYSSYLSDESS